MTEKMRVGTLDGARLFYLNLLSVSGKSTQTFVHAFVGLVEIDARIATRNHPFTMKPVWPKVGE